MKDFTQTNRDLKLGRKREAFEEFQHAALLTKNVQEQKFLLKQAKDCLK